MQRWRSCCNHRGGRDFPKTLLRYATGLEEKLRAGIRYLILVDHKVVFIGPVGVGKSTVINTLFGLTLPPRKGRDGSAKLAGGLLPTGSVQAFTFVFSSTWQILSHRPQNGRKCCSPVKIFPLSIINHQSTIINHKSSLGSILL